MDGGAIPESGSVIPDLIFEWKQVVNPELMGAALKALQEKAKTDPALAEELEAHPPEIYCLTDADIEEIAKNEGIQASAIFQYWHKFLDTAGTNIHRRSRRVCECTIRDSRFFAEDRYDVFPKVQIEANLDRGRRMNDLYVATPRMLKAHGISLP